MCITKTGCKPYWKMELHIHTSSSNDSLLTMIPLFLMCKLKNIDCIAITDHNVIANAKTFAPFFQKHGIRVVVGEEIMTTKGEIIGLFLEKQIPPKLSPEQTVQAIIEQGGIVYVPHPFETSRARTVLKTAELNELHEKIALMECHNGRNREISFSEQQNFLCEQLNIPKVIGSDAHTFFEIGRNYICIKPFFSPSEFMSNIFSAEHVKAPNIPFAHGVTKTVKVLKMIGKRDFDGLSRVIKKRCGKK